MAEAAESSRERWQRWEEETGYERGKGRAEPAAPSKSVPSLHKWAERKAAEITPGLLKKAAGGGFTYRPFAEKHSPTTGLMVSLHPKDGFNMKLDIHGKLNRAETRKQVQTWIAKSLERIAGKDSEHLGGWLQTKDGDKPLATPRLHLDVSYRVRNEGDLERAKAMGRANNQISILRLSDFKEFATGGTG